MNNRVLIYDPVPFKGGSKKVMQTIVADLPCDVEVWVISNDKGSWCDCNVHFIPLFSPICLQNKTTGFLYFIKHFVFFCSLMVNLIKLKRFAKIIGFSGPCVDFSLYILTEIIIIDIIQLIQGDIANSKIAGFGLSRAKQVFYLPSTHASILNVLKCHRNNESLTNKKYIPFINGINRSTIKVKENNNKIGFLWAASLLKWKRVEVFITAITELNRNYECLDKYFASVCYIEPQTDSYIDVVNFDKVDNIHWYRDPNNLNDIRASSSVFISTSENEPFGLSILESMAAGLAIVIPSDNAYWDQHLIDGHDCVKYDPNNMDTLVEVLLRLINDQDFLLKISKQARCSAQKYSHESCYSQILKCIPN